jgi:hypothetical protein
MSDKAKIQTAPRDPPADWKAPTEAEFSKKKQSKQSDSSVRLPSVLVSSSARDLSIF